jgi:transcriptional regulator with XRE-family HTH domain
MDFSAIGQRIRELRKSLKLSQDELAQGICTQAQISKIEKGDVYPYANTLYLISQKLGVDVNYFFEIGSTPRVDYVNEVSRQLRLTRRHLLYEEMNRIVKLEEDNPLFTQNGRNRQLILWHKGVYEHAVNNNVEKSIELLKSAIDLTHVLDKVWNEREIEVLMSMGAVYVTDNQNEISLKIFLEAKEHLSHLVFISDHSILPRLYYNIARVYTRLKQYDESITYCKNGIKYCLEKDNLFPLAELHYQVSYNLEKLGKYSDSIYYLNKAISIFELIEDKKYMNLLKEKKSSLELHYGDITKADHSKT